MLTALYLFAAAIQVALAVMMWRLHQRSRSPYALIPLLVMLALVADNFIIGIGRFIGAGDTLKALNAIRFITHALFTPWMIVFTLDFARRAGLQWACTNWAKYLFWGLAIAMCLLGVYADIVLLRMEPVIDAETLRYRNAGHPPGPPLPAIVTILVMTIAGLSLWRKTKSPWVFAGALIEFICAPIGFRIPIAGQFGEIAFCGAMLSGEQIAQKAEGKTL
jgi:hypothetical protein